MFRLVVALLLALSLPAAARAESPREALQRVFAEANRILMDPGIDGQPLARFSAIEKLVGDAFDVRGAAEMAFGRRWNTITPTERDEFTRLFTRLLTRSYLFRLTSKANLDSGVQIQYLNEAIDGREALVRTAVARRDGRDTLADYRMFEIDGRWRTRDVLVDGFSVMANYRAQVSRILETSTVPELLGQMRAKLGAPDEPGVTTAAASASAAPTASPATPAVATAAPAATPAAPEARPTKSAGETRGATSPTPAASQPASAAPASTAAPAPAPDVIATAPAPVAPAIATAPAPIASVPTKTYWLQIGAFRTVEEAGQLAARFRGSKVVMAPEGQGAGGKSVLKVRVGPFTDAADAVNELLDLQTKGFDPYLVAERN